MTPWGKKEIDHTNLETTLDAVQSAFFHLWLLDSDNCEATESQAWACPKQKYPNVYSWGYHYFFLELMLQRLIFFSSMYPPDTMSVYRSISDGLSE